MEETVRHGHEYKSIFESSPSPNQSHSGNDNENQQHYSDIESRNITSRSSTDKNSCSSSAGSSCEIRNGSGSKPHKAHDSAWEAIGAVKSRDGAVGLGHFKLLQRLGTGDIGNVYLGELHGSGCYFALKVMDKRSLASRNKVLRAKMEKEILEQLDHPFLPTLYAHMESSQFSCLVMEFCPGGDLHMLRQRQPAKRFAEHAVRFYAAEMLLALEYLHMLGIVYRDLKPENVLVRDDGHIMLTDFDLSLKCSVNPTLTGCSSIVGGQGLSLDYHQTPPCSHSSCILPLRCVAPCSVHPVASCLPFSLPRLLHLPSSKRKSKQPSCYYLPGDRLPELIAEPKNVRSMSFVGTHEYLAPEIILGNGHGSPVDWWTFGIFLFEMLYARTPFKGADNNATLMNVTSQPLEFPSANPEPSSAVQDLIRGLLVKDPHKRLGAVRGAAEIKQHSFFEGVNWALVRCADPPGIPTPFTPHKSKSANETSATPQTRIVTDNRKQWTGESNQPDTLPDFELF